MREIRYDFLPENRAVQQRTDRICANEKPFTDRKKINKTLKKRIDKGDAV